MLIISPKRTALNVPEASGSRGFPRSIALPRLRCPVSSSTESLHCRAKPGHFYDPLLKKCMLCTELCGSHPVECSHACQENGAALPRGEHHTVIIYSLLGLCLAALFCTLSVALLVLMCKCRGRRGHSAGPQEKESSDDSHCPSSKDRLMDAVDGGRGQGLVEEKKAWPTETCVHCFPELQAQRRVVDKLPPPALYQQATGIAPPAGDSMQQHQVAVAVAENGHALFGSPGGKDGPLRIICSPTQSG
ncbi:hypothetical protein SKAU_G00116610 [Synaphobranchus kaupii]|uniref:TACI cysteine-rich domain-containing protein n=1 Tax=Synaphobranchus kaupii TaxID=118154 RepID=A0A9Q1FMR6_SYNKA|nr:hypothetical protein SKAU_G00116610 [Synaphobranchus kaupii]